MSFVADRFSLIRVCELITQHGLVRCVLQFPDEELEHCVAVYEFMSTQLPPTVCLFIAADSTFGSSVDDISAQHVDGDVLVFFGSDLSSSGAMPVLVVPSNKHVPDVEDCLDKFTSASRASTLSSTSTTTAPEEGSATAAAEAPLEIEALLLYEPGYSQSVLHDIAQRLAASYNMKITLASLPLCADLSSWSPSSSSPSSSSSSSASSSSSSSASSSSLSSDADEAGKKQANSLLLGGLLIPASSSGSSSIDLIFYIGDKSEQLSSIMLHFSQQTLLAYSPMTKALLKIRGQDSKIFRERYGGVSRVKDSSIIGIIIGSMGLTGESTRLIVTRLEGLIHAAGKKSYTFVMGRLNEAKLCNFPEIDLFCFVSNEDTSLIAPKTFHVPVITPWELELGLEVREWTSVYMSNPNQILDGTSLQEAVGHLTEMAKGEEEEEESVDASSHLSDENEGQGQGEASSSALVRVAVEGTSLGGGAGGGARGQGGALIAFESPAGEFLKARDFQGLSPQAPAGLSTAVQQGLSGIASSYE